MLREYFNLVFKSLKNKKLRSWLTMIGIFIGIASVVSLIGLGEGLRSAITGQFGSLGTDMLTVQASGIGFAGPPGTGAVNPLTKDLVDKIERVDGVKEVLPRLIETGKIEFNDQLAIGFAMSLPPDGKGDIMYDKLSLEIEIGRELEEKDINGVVVGNNFLNDDILGKPLSVGDSVLIQDKKFKVLGIFEKKGSFIFDSVIVMNEKIMRDLWDNEEDVNVIVVQVKDADEVSKVKEGIEKVLRKERGVKEGEEDFSIETPENAIAQVNSTLIAVQIFVYVIAAISLLVGGIGIMNTMYTSVLERTKEIGVMKSIGARNSHIFILFFIESGLLGMVGGIIGLILGITLAKGLAFIGGIALGSDLIQAHISLGLLIGSLLFSFGIGSIAGLLPAFKAANMHPVDALRFAK